MILFLPIFYSKFPGTINNQHCQIDFFPIFLFHSFAIMIWWGQKEVTRRLFRCHQSGSYADKTISAAAAVIINPLSCAFFVDTDGGGATIRQSTAPNNHSHLRKMAGFTLLFLRKRHFMKFNSKLDSPLCCIPYIIFIKGKQEQWEWNFGSGVGSFAGARTLHHAHIFSLASFFCVCLIIGHLK